LARTPRNLQREGDAAITSNYDGVRRSGQLEDNITEMVALAFASPVGQQALDYLRSVTLHRISAPGATDAELRELEGQRRLVAGLIARIRAYDNRRKAVTAKED